MLIAVGLSHAAHQLKDLQERVTSLFGGAWCTNLGRSCTRSIAHTHTHMSPSRLLFATGKVRKDKDIRTYGSIVIDVDSQEREVFEEHDFVDEVEREDARRLSYVPPLVADDAAHALTARVVQQQHGPDHGARHRSAQLPRGHDDLCLDPLGLLFRYGDASESQP
jgi:hypothetical protein